MKRIVISESSEIPADNDLKAWIYNALDCCITAQVAEKQEADLKDLYKHAPDYPDFIFGKQSVFLEMGLRGVRVSQAAVADLRKRLLARRSKALQLFDKICQEVFGRKFLPSSSAQMIELFYGQLRLRPYMKRVGMKSSPTTDREAIEKLAKRDLICAPLAKLLLTLRDVDKALGFLKTDRNPDGRLRTNYSVYGTVTGRLSSAKTPWRVGTNLQNVAKELRQIVEPDPGMLLVNVDLEQADARNLGARVWTLMLEKGRSIEEAGKFLDACEGGDLHTMVARMVWPDLPWSDDPANWRKTADQKFYREKSYRDIAKQLGHGTNYRGTPRTMAMHSKLPVKLIEDFQQKYFAAFPGIHLWHQWVVEQIQTTGTLITLFGRVRHFFGNPKDNSVLNAAVAFEPQSMTGEEIDRGIMQLYKAFSKEELQILLQVHDSVTFQVPYDGHEELIPRALEILKVTIELKNGRLFHVPLDAQVGYNWGPASESNPRGLKNWTGKETRKPATGAVYGLR